MKYFKKFSDVFSDSLCDGLSESCTGGLEAEREKESE